MTGRSGIRTANGHLRFEDSRGALCVARHLSVFNGSLQMDGHRAYTSLVKARSHETITPAGRWSHVRRKFSNFMSAVSITWRQRR